MSWLGLVSRLLLWFGQISLIWTYFASIYQILGSFSQTLSVVSLTVFWCVFLYVCMRLLPWCSPGSNKLHKQRAVPVLWRGRLPDWLVLWFKLTDFPIRGSEHWFGRWRMGGPRSWVSRRVKSGHRWTALNRMQRVVWILLRRGCRAVVTLTRFVKQVASQFLPVAKCAAILETKELIIAQLQLERISFFKWKRCQCWSCSDVCLSCNTELFWHYTCSSSKLGRFHIISPCGPGSPTIVSQSYSAS